MGNLYLRKYGAATTLNFELYKIDGSALKSDAASATHDIKIMKDEGPEADTTADAFVDEGQGYSLALSATELEAARITIYIVDQTSPQAWLDKVLLIDTYGHTSAQHAFDLDTATQNVNVLTQSNIDFGALQKTSLNAATPALSAAGIDAILDDTCDSTITVRQALKIILAAVAGKTTVAGSTVNFRDVANGKNRIAAVVDAATKTRTTVTLDGT